MDAKVKRSNHDGISPEVNDFLSFSRCICDRCPSARSVSVVVLLITLRSTSINIHSTNIRYSHWFHWSTEVPSRLPIGGFCCFYCVCSQCVFYDVPSRILDSRFEFCWFFTTENDHGDKKVKIKTFHVVSGQNEIVHRVLRWILVCNEQGFYSQKVFKKLYRYFEMQPLFFTQASFLLSLF